MSTEVVSPARWRTPAFIIFCGGLIAILTFGPRSTFGFFLQPMSLEFNWGRDVFGFAVAIQNLLWGLGQPFAGAFADRFGIVRSLWIGAVLYAAGLIMMAYSTTPGTLTLSAGVVIGFGLSGASFNIVLSAFGKTLPEEWRTFSFGVGTAAGSFGQFLFSPLCIALQQAFGWKTTLVIFGVMVLLVLPLSLALAPGSTAAKPAAGVPQQSFGAALSEAFRHPSYVLLVLGFFTCGFHVAFITTHLPPYLVDKGLDVSWGAWVIGLIGLFNIIGSLSSGWLGARYPKRYLLASIYFARAVAFAIFLLLPVTPYTAIGFGAVIGLLWLSTVPPTTALVPIMFGTRYMATLGGFVFFSHQVGAFLGVWLGGVLYESTGSYDMVWWLGAALGIVAGLLHLPIQERPVARLAPAAT
jgi:MFS family permease